MPAARVNGVRIRYELRGAGEPLVLVHGSWGDHHNWDAVVPRLSPAHRVLTYDRRGHSESERPEGPGSVLEDVEDLAALVREVLGGRADIVGNSFGALISLRCAAAHPGLCRRLAVHEPPAIGLLDPEGPHRQVLEETGRRIAAVVAVLEGGDAEGGARQFVETVGMGPGAWEKLSSAMQKTFIRNAPTWLDEMRDREAFTIDPPSLLGFSGRTLLTTGGKSPPFFAPIADRIAANLGSVERRTFAEAGHIPHVSHPVDYANALNAFLGGP